MSCGALVWEQVRQGQQVSIWTLCAGDAPAGPLSPFASELHARWQTGAEAGAARRSEDSEACQHLGASYRHLPLRDCIYRRQGEPFPTPGASPPEPPLEPGEFLYATRDAIFGPLHPAETPLVSQLGAFLASQIPAQAQVVCPLAIGGHVDHRLTVAAAQSLAQPVWFYADYPYIASQPEEIAKLEDAGWQRHTWDISAPAQAAWEAAVAAHRSQISTFWPDQASLQAALQAHRQFLGGAALWYPQPGGIQPPELDS